MRRELMMIVLAGAAGGLPALPLTSPAAFAQPEPAPAGNPSGEALRDRLEGDQPEQPEAGEDAFDNAPLENAQDLQDESMDEPFTFGPFSQPIEITAFVSYVAETLGINISRDASLTGQVAFNTGVEITKRDLLPLLDARLEELGYTIVQDTTGFYTILKRENVPLSGDQTMRFIQTPGVLPSSLRDTISTLLGLPTVQPGQATSGARISYQDEIGSIIMVDTPRRIAAVEKLVEQFIEQRAALITRTIPLEHISAPRAKKRAEELLSSDTRPTGFNPQFNQNDPNNQQQSRGSGSGSLSNRLSIDASGNNLIFRGLESEFEEIRSIIEAVDRPSQLEPKVYFTGSSSRAIAEFAEKNGFGEADFVSTTADDSNSPFRQFNPRQVQNQFQQGDPDDEIVGGSRLLVDEGRGRIIYFGTPTQQEIFARLVEQIDADDETITLETYKLEYANAEEVADILQSLIDRQRPQTESSAFLPGQQTPPRNFFDPTAPFEEEDPEAGGFNPDPNTSFVVADAANNQVIVTSPRSQQEEFARLIDELDLRRSQVYIEAIIVAVNDNDDFRFAVESQFLDINGDGEGGGVRTNFGLSTLDMFTSSTSVATGLGGVTGALIDDDYVPLIVNATQTDSHSRVVARPQLLVDDNSQATVLTSQQVPFQTTIVTDVSERTSFEFETAQTSLTVTPQISAGGTIRMEYDIVLEDFTGPAAGGAPPPKQTNNIAGASVTVPSDMTVVIGGLVVEAESESYIRVPIIGDIPYIGRLFGDTQNGGRNTTLYVFLKPRAMKEPSNTDYMILTRGPQLAAGIDWDIPELPPIIMESTFSLPDEPEPLGVDGEEAAEEGEEDDGRPRIGLPSETDPDLDQRDLSPDDDED